MTVLFCDLETYSTVPIRRGSHAYAQRAEVLLWAYAVDDGPILVWDLTKNPEMPGDLAMMLDDPTVTTVWHNGAMFDRVVLKKAMPEVYELLPIERIHDTMVQALAHGLPGKLDQLCGIMGVPFDLAKDKEGTKWINLFCKPQSRGKLQRATRETHPEEWARFVSYAGNDISSMRYLYKVLPKWNYQGRELELWRLDQKINERGIRVDTELARAALAAIEKEQRRLGDRVEELTEGELKSANQRDALLRYILEEHGVTLPDMKGSTLETRLKDETLPEGAKELIRIRLQSAATSTAKYKVLLNSNVDGVLAGLLQFCGASRTGRWSAKLFQPQNLPRPDLDQELIDAGIVATKMGMADQFTDFIHDKDKEPCSVMKILTNMIRGCLIARAGKKLVVSDLANIEGRSAAFLAGEEWKLGAFLESDNDPDAPDMYKRSYGRAFNVDPLSVDKFQRQIGKVMELALGYEGGVGAFLTFVHTYKLDLDALTAAAMPTLSPEVIKDARGMLEWRRRKRLTTYGLSDDTFIVCEALKRLWRDAHPAIASYWKELEEAAREAILNPGVAQHCRRLRFVKNGAWLRMILPSGRSVCYPSAHLEGGKIKYWGINQYSRKWSKISTYGGKLFENACQAFARDVMAYNMATIEEAGYDILLTVHDELITEANDNVKFNQEVLSDLLAANDDWNLGLPLATSGFEDTRYRKDG